MKYLLVLTALSIHAATATGQEAVNDSHLQQLADELIGYRDDDTNYEELYENLAQVLSSPYDLNRISREELQYLHILNDSQIKAFLDYRKDQGILVDIHELQVIPGFDSAAINRLLPFVRVIDPDSRVNTKLLRRIWSAGNSYMITRYERTLDNNRPDASTGAPYAGSPDKWYLRFRSAQSSDFSIGFTAEKDAGERILFQPQNKQWGFDFTSWHIQIRNKGKIRNLIAGDFQTQFAQGLVFGGAFGLGKGGESVATTRRSQVGFVPYTSVNESACKSGIAVSMDLSRHIGLSLFYSRTHRDASTTNDDDTVLVSAFQTTGYHRTEAELSKRKKIAEQNSGIVMRVINRNLDAGILFNLINFELPVERNPTLYNQFVFRGPTNVNAGFFLNYTFENISFFSEVAQSLDAGRAVITGALLTPYKKLEIAMVYRDYQKDFHPFYSNAFSENTQPQNERGIYWGWKYRWNRKFVTTGYVDQFTFPWLSFRRYSPSQGYEWLLRLSYHPTKKIALFVQAREESKEKKTADTPLYKTATAIKRNFALQCDYGIGEKIRMKTRIQYNSLEHSAIFSDGLALIQDLGFSVGRIRFAGRHSIFYTGSFDNRHYVYESDAWLAYSLPAYTGTGVRNYALIEIKVHKNLTLWLRYARTRLLKEHDIRRTAGGFEGNTRNDVKFQARFSF